MENAEDVDFGIMIHYPTPIFLCEHKRTLAVKWGKLLVVSPLTRFSSSIGECVNFLLEFILDHSITTER